MSVGVGVKGGEVKGENNFNELFQVVLVSFYLNFINSIDLLATNFLSALFINRRAG